MKTILLLFSVLTLLTSCKGQTLRSETNASVVTESIAKGEIVNKLGDQLWYVFQDTKNNYWFSSHGDGVYRFDGEKIVHFTTKDGLANDTIRQIQEDKFGNIYIATFVGISKYDGKKFTHWSPSKVTNGN